MEKSKPIANIIARAAEELGDLNYSIREIQISGPAYFDLMRELGRSPSKENHYTQDLITTSGDIKITWVDGNGEEKMKTKTCEHSGAEVPVVNEVVDRVDCQRCTKESRAIEGCKTCGGYGLVITQVTCPCGNKYWVRPGTYTSYEGKEWHSFDGLKITDHASGSTCAKCSEGNKENK